MIDETENLKKAYNTFLHNLNVNIEKNQNEEINMAIDDVILEIKELMKQHGLE